MSDELALQHIPIRELACFAGAGGGVLGGKRLKWRTTCAVELDAFPRSRLLQRQREGHLEPFPIWDDVTTFDGKPWQGSIDIVTGGFPCQDISIAGGGDGLEGERSGLWREMARIIGEVRPPFVLVENSPMLRTARKRRARIIEVVGSLFGSERRVRDVTVRTRPDLYAVLGQLAEMGYDAQWGVVGASDAGGSHGRDRIWILGWRRELANSDLRRCLLGQVEELAATAR